MYEQNKLQMLEHAYIHTDSISKIHSPSFLMVRFQIRKKQQEINTQLKFKHVKKQIPVIFSPPTALLWVKLFVNLHLPNTRSVWSCVSLAEFTAS